MFKNTASQKVAVYAYDVAGDTPKTGDAANITAYISKDGAGAVQSNDVNPAELSAANMPGVYVFDLTQAETDCDLFSLVAKSGTADVKLDPVVAYTIELSAYKADVSALALEASVQAVKAKTDNLPASPAAVGSEMALEDDAITAAKFDESTAFPLKAADSGASYVAREGASGGGAITLTDLSTTIDGIPTSDQNANAVWDEAIADHTNVITFGGKNQKGVPSETIADYKADVSALALEASVQAIKAKTDNLPADPAGVSDLAALALEASVQAVKAKTDNLPADPAGVSDLALLALEASLQAVKTKTDGLNFTGTDVKATLDGEETDVGSVKGTALQAKVGPNFDAFYQNSGVDTSKEVDDVGGGAGSTDWTAGERENIRQALGVTGSKSATSSGNLDAVKAKTDNLPASPAAVGSEMALEDDAITAAKYDESTAFPVKSADAGATELARTGADGDTLETLSDQIDAAALETTAQAIKAKTDNLPADPAAVSDLATLALEASLQAVKAKTDNLPVDPAAVSDLATLALEASLQAVKAKTDNLPADPAGVSDLAALALEASLQAVKAKTDNLPASPAAAGDEMALTAAAIDAIIADLRDATWTAGGSNTVADILKAAFGMARGNMYRDGDEYKVYDDDDTGSEDGTLLFTLTIGSTERTSS